MNEQQFWELIETCWQQLPMLDSLRQEALQTNEASLFEGLSFGLEDEVVEELENRLQALDKEQLISFIALMEEKLFSLDREKIHLYTDGSDDGFLYCRGFIVGMGVTYYKRVDSTPSRAMMDTEAESVCFVGYKVYKDKYEQEFKRGSFFSIESGSNPQGWTSG